jgi:hypothetical protein
VLTVSAVSCVLQIPGCATTMCTWAEYQNVISTIAPYGASCGRGPAPTLRKRRPFAARSK